MTSAAASTTGPVPRYGSIPRSRSVPLAVGIFGHAIAMERDCRGPASPSAGMWPRTLRSGGVVAAAEHQANFG